jgi:hypothetical protein
LKKFEAFANVEFWQHLIKFLNKTLEDSCAMSSFSNAFFWCAYYKKSTGHMVNNLTLFPSSLGGEDCFDQRKMLFSSPRRQLQTLQDAYFATIPEI